MNARQARALSQRILLVRDSLAVTEEGVECRVIGSRGTEYTVKIGSESTCDCPDATFNQQTCKHLYFVLAKVLQMEEDVWRHGNRHFMASTVEIMQVKALLRRENTWPSQPAEGEDKTTTTPQVKRRDVREQKECPVCLEEFQESEELVWCTLSCGYNLHRTCFSRCQKPTCPLCRSEMAVAPKKRKRAE